MNYKLITIPNEQGQASYFPRLLLGAQEVRDLLEPLVFTIEGIWKDGGKLMMQFMQREGRYFYRFSMREE